MSGRKGWMAAVAAIALAVVGTSVMIVGTALRDPQGRGEGRRAEAAAADTGVARGGSVPKGQAPAVALTVPRFQNAFNAEAGNRRLLLLLSPT